MTSELESYLRHLLMENVWGITALSQTLLPVPQGQGVLFLLGCFIPQCQMIDCCSLQTWQEESHVRGRRGGGRSRDTLRRSNELATHICENYLSLLQLFQALCLAAAPHRSPRTVARCAAPFWP